VIRARPAGLEAVIEFRRAGKRAWIWPAPARDLEIMKRVKNLFDPRTF